MYFVDKEIDMGAWFKLVDIDEHLSQQSSPLIYDLNENEVCEDDSKVVLDNINNFIPHNKELFKFAFYAPRGYSILGVVADEKDFRKLHYEAGILASGILVNCVKKLYPMINYNYIKALCYQHDLYDRVPSLNFNFVLPRELKEYSGKSVKLDYMKFPDCFDEIITPFNEYMYESLLKRKYELRRVGKNKRFELEEFHEFKLMELMNNYDPKLSEYV